MLEHLSLVLPSETSLETIIWDAIEVVGTPASPRSDHTDTVNANRYLVIFGGGSHSTYFLQSMEWSRPKMQGSLPSPRAGHAGVKVCA